MFIVRQWCMYRHLKRQQFLYLCFHWNIEESLRCNTGRKHDLVGQTRAFTHKGYSLKEYTREERRKEWGSEVTLYWFFFLSTALQPTISSGVHTQISLLLPVITLVAPLDSSTALSLMRKMTDKISYCSATGHCILLSSPLSKSPHLISKSKQWQTWRMLDCIRQFQNSAFYVHTQ